MTFNKLMSRRRNGRHALRSSAAVAAILDVHHEESAFEADAWHRSTATRNVLAHTSHEWNALRHAV
jgi:hypothetical protein